MVIGALVRTEMRGLGVQSRAFVKHMGASPLVISIPNRSEHVCPADLSLYPDVPVARVHSGWRLEPDVVRPWLETITHLWSAETLYSPEMANWCRELGVVSVVHANPEFTPLDGGYGLGRPDRWWSATPWRLDAMPRGTEVVPWPVEPAVPVEPHDGECRWLHVQGRAAIGDRNGTDVVFAALRHLMRPCTVRIVTQEPGLPRIRAPRHVTVETVCGGVDEPADLYRGVDALVYPRRYGGLSLVVHEAMAAGLAVVLPNVAPNYDVWPALLVAAHNGTVVPTVAGPVHAADVNPADLAAAMDSLADPAVRHGWQARSRQWARSHSWETLRGEYVQRFEALRSTSPAA